MDTFCPWRLFCIFFLFRFWLWNFFETAEKQDKGICEQRVLLFPIKFVVLLPAHSSVCLQHFRKHFNVHFFLCALLYGWFMVNAAFNFNFLVFFICFVVLYHVDHSSYFHLNYRIYSAVRYTFSVLWMHLLCTMWIVCN